MEKRVGRERERKRERESDISDIHTYINIPAGGYSRFEMSFLGYMLNHVESQRQGDLSIRFSAPNFCDFTGSICFSEKHLWGIRMDTSISALFCFTWRACCKLLVTIKSKAAKARCKLLVIVRSVATSDSFRMQEESTILASPPPPQICEQLQSKRKRKEPYWRPAPPYANMADIKKRPKC